MDELDRSLGVSPARLAAGQLPGQCCKSALGKASLAGFPRMSLTLLALRPKDHWIDNDQFLS